VAAAARKSVVTRTASASLTGSNRLRRDWTCSRARWLIWRTVAVGLLTAEPMSS
jgi:hypothetical protein